MIDFKALDVNLYALIEHLGVKRDETIVRDHQPILASNNFQRRELTVSACIFLGYQYEDEYIIPEYQRELVWKKKQKVSLIESILHGNSIGDIVINEVNKGKNGDLKIRVIDGQQRIAAFRSFFNREFKVFGKFVEEFKYWDLRTILEYRIYSHIGKNLSEDEEVEIYLARNCGGTMHTKEEINKALSFKKK